MHFIVKHGFLTEISRVAEFLIGSKLHTEHTLRQICHSNTRGKKWSCTYTELWQIFSPNIENLKLGNVHHLGLQRYLWDEHAHSVEALRTRWTLSTKFSLSMKEWLLSKVFLDFRWKSLFHWKSQNFGPQISKNLPSLAHIDIKRLLVKVNLSLKVWLSTKVFLFSLSTKVTLSTKEWLSLKEFWLKDQAMLVKCEVYTDEFLS
jgi:hypothetical protein